VATATSLTAAENDAVAAKAGPGEAYFTYKGSEYFIARPPPKRRSPPITPLLNWSASMILLLLTIPVT
jgi:hypothetical protein